AILVWQYGKAGAWVLLCGMLRYLFVAAGYMWSWLQRPLPPSRRRQTICIVQVVSLSVVIVPLIEPPVSSVIAAVALSALCYSFLIDVVWLWRHAGRLVRDEFDVRQLAPESTGTPRMMCPGTRHAIVGGHGWSVKPKRTMALDSARGRARRSRCVAHVQQPLADTGRELER